MRQILPVLLLLLCGCIHPVQPPTPVPPTPDVVPVPPTPPTPDIQPMGKIAVLIIEEIDDRQKPGANDYVQAYQSLQVREYMKSHGKVIDGHSFLVLDKDADVSYLSDFWQQGFRKPRSSVPWIYITNGETGISSPMPSDEAALLTLLQKCGG